EATTKGLDIVGFYHSHPDHPAQPSQFDLEHAFPGWSYVIVSVSRGTSGDLKSWVMKEDRSGFDEEGIANRKQ
ncbi:MAG TPA: M67 family metallopeptidase, partial [Bacteroidota bacterium]